MNAPSQPPSRVQPHHQALLDASMIADAVRDARGYYTETVKARLRDLGFGRAAAIAPTLVLPIYGVMPNLRSYQHRPDEPRLDRERARFRKYESPHGVGMMLDHNPLMWPSIQDPKAPLFVFEGIRKVDSGASIGLAGVGVVGTWGFRGTDKQGGKAALADWEVIPVEGRDLIIAYDSDVLTNPHVYTAHDRLAAFLSRRGAHVGFLYLPTGEAGQKTGFDDWRAMYPAADRTTVLAMIEWEQRPFPGVDPNAALDEIRYLDVSEFVAALPTHKYLHRPTGVLWPAASVDVSAKPVETSEADMSGLPIKVKPSLWLDQHGACQQIIWQPGAEEIIDGWLYNEGGRVEDPTYRAYNLFRPATLRPGEPEQARPWLDHLHWLYPEDAEHLIRWFAQRVQDPGIKLNHAVLLGGEQGTGKDTLLKPIERAVGPWNYRVANPTQIVGRFNDFLMGTILLVTELHDLGTELSRWGFYERMKPIIAAPPDFLRCDRKYLQEVALPNVIGVVMTTNTRIGLYLPAGDRRHYCAWSPRTRAEALALGEEHFLDLHHWLDSEGGDAHVLAYLQQVDLSAFDPKAPPRQTAWFWDIVNADRPVEEAELASVLDAMTYAKRYEAWRKETGPARRKEPTWPPITEDMWPLAITRGTLMAGALADPSRIIRGDDPGDHGSIVTFLTERKSRKQLMHRLEALGYVAVRNPDATDGLWVVNGARGVIYARSHLDRSAQYKAAGDLATTLNKSGEQTEKAGAKNREASEQAAKTPPRRQKPTGNSRKPPAQAEGKG